MSPATRQILNALDTDFKERTSIDLFAGCGGLSLGLLKAGWSGLMAIEADPNAFETLKQNLILKPMTKTYDWVDWLPKEPISIEDLIEKHSKKLKEMNGKVTLVAGGPPCQGFSMAGARCENDPRNSLLDKFLEVVEIVQPQLVLLENVEGIRRPFLNGEKGSKNRPQAPSEILTGKIKKIGYRCKWLTLDSADFLVAQKRVRSFLIGLREDGDNGSKHFEPLSQVIKAKDEFIQKLKMKKKRISVKEAISDLETLRSCRDYSSKKKTIPYLDSKRFKQVVYSGPKNQYQQMLHEGLEKKEAPNSMRLVIHRDDTVKRFIFLLDYHEKGKDLSKVLLKKYEITKHCLSILDPKKPAPTITSIPDDFIHYCEPRVLTVRELARIQSFPDWFGFHGKYTTGGKRRREEVPRYTQVANAIPPFLAEVLGMALINILEGQDVVN